MTITKDAIQLKRLFEEKDPFDSVSPEDLAKRGVDIKGRKLPDEEILGQESKVSLYDIEEVEILYWHDLDADEHEELDYVQDQEGSFFRYDGNIFDLGNFMRTEKGHELYDAGWHGYEGSSIGTGYVVKIDDSGDGVTIARAVWSDLD